jgi:hypothetical protein
MGTDLITTSTQTIRSFWERPEGKLGYGVLAASAVGVFVGVKLFGESILDALTLLTKIAGQATAMVIMFAILALLIYILQNKRFQKAVSYMFKSAMRAVTGFFITIDAIGIMRGYIEELLDKKKVLDTRKSDLRGQIRAGQNLIEQNAQEAAQAMSTFKVAKEQGKTTLATVSAKNAGRLDDFNDRLKGQVKKMEMLYTLLNKYSESCDGVILDLQGEVKMRQRDQNFSKTSHSAVKAAMDILKGGGPGKELYDQADEYLIEDYGRKMGEIEDFVISTETIMQGIDVQNGVWEDRALQQLNAIESKTNSVLLGGERRLAIENHQSDSPIITTQQNEPVANYNKFFETDNRKNIH